MKNINENIVIEVRENGSKRVSHTFDPESSLTEQKHKKDCDINYLVNKYDPREVQALRASRTGQYGMVDGQSFQDAMYIVTEANGMFHELPSELRKKFNHDPAEFLDFVQNPENAKEMVSLGLARNMKDLPGLVPQDRVYEIIQKGVAAIEGGSEAPPAEPA